jgi:uncharacterized membrane protein
MKARFQYIIELLKTSFWFVPLLILICAVALAFGLTWLDSILDFNPTGFFLYFYTGGAESARIILSTIAGAMLGVASIVFSITLVALSLASSQFGPRLMRNFMHDRLNQVVLGTYIATFIFSLLVLRTVKSEGTDDFVPNISILFTLLISIGSIILLVIFIHHISMGIQADQIISNIYENLDKSLHKHFPVEMPESETTNNGEVLEKLKNSMTVYLSPRNDLDGYLQTIHEGGLMEVAVEHDLLLVYKIRPGDFLVRNTELVSVYGRKEFDEKMKTRIIENFVVGQKRTPLSDPVFAIHQMVEISSRALSPGINDPFTAITVIDKLTAAMCYLTQATFPSGFHYDDEGNLRIVSRPFTFTGMLDASFNQIRQYGADSPSVLIKLMEALLTLFGFARNSEQAENIRRHAEMVHRTAQITFKEPNDFNDISQRYKNFD